MRNARHRFLVPSARAASRRRFCVGVASAHISSEVALTRNCTSSWRMFEASSKTLAAVEAKASSDPISAVTAFSGLSCLSVFAYAEQLQSENGSSVMRSVTASMLHPAPMAWVPLLFANFLTSLSKVLGGLMPWSNVAL
eukprot:3837097-Amphidinium_carterae.1